MKHFALTVLAIAAFALVAYYTLRVREARSDVPELLLKIPEGTSAVVSIDLLALRKSPFLENLTSWAPPPVQDEDYRRFVQDTGFDYEHDLDRLAIFILSGKLLAVADGRFDRKKISSYALRTGTKVTVAGREAFRVAAARDKPAVQFAFLGDHRLALSNDPEVFSTYFTELKPQPEWLERFLRLAGSSVFAVVRRDALAANVLPRQAPGGFQSPELSSLLAQLQWLTIAAKPEANYVRLVAEGECPTEITAIQLADTLNGIVMLAEAGLNDAKTMKPFEPALREAYLDLLKTADISKIDRGETKSVRVLLLLTPKLLQAARAAESSMPHTAPQKEPSAKREGR